MNRKIFRLFRYSTVSVLLLGLLIPMFQISIVLADNGTEQAWVARHNGTGAPHMALDGSGNIYVAGPNAVIKYSNYGVQMWSIPTGATDIAVDTSGNVYITGTAGTIKYNTNGVQQWVASPVGQFVAIAVDVSGNVYVTGSIPDGTGSQYATAKYSSSGAQQWFVTHKGTANMYNVASAIVVDTFGNVYITGASFNGSLSYATIKYDANGVQQWTTYWDGDGYGDCRASAIQLDPAGNVYVTGRKNLPSNTMISTYATVKYNNSGVQQWVSLYGKNSTATAIALDGSGNIYVTGYDYAYSGNGNYQTPSDYATIKNDTNGFQQWVARYNSPANGNDVAKDVLVDISGSVYVTGSSYDSVSGSDYATVKYDNSGVQQWFIRYNGPGNSSDGASAIKLDGAGNIYVTGYSGSDYATIKYGSHVPEISIEGNSTEIVSGDITPSLTDYTDFGNIQVVGGTVDRTFVIKNIGDASLTLSGTPKVSLSGTNAADFTVTVQPVSPVNAGGQTTFIIHFNPSASGLRSATVSIVNDDSDENPYTFAIQGSVNHAPVLNPIGNKSVVAGSMLTFTISATDQDGDSLQYSADNMPIGASLQGTTFYWPPTTAQVGTYPDVHFQVSDGGLSDSEDMTIVVTNGSVNHAPVLAPIGNQTVNEGQLFTFSISATDPDGDSLIFSTYNLPSGADFNPATKTFSWMPDYSQAGDYLVTFIVSDGSTSAYEIIDIKVENVVLLSDSPLTQVWIASYNGSGSPHMALDTSGNSYVAGPSAVIKYNGGGVQQWAVSTNINTYAMAADPSGNIYIMGSSTVKYNTNGVLQWSIPSPINDPNGRLAAMALDPFGNVYVTGYSPISTGGPVGYETIKYNGNGVEQWVIRYASPSGYAARALAIAVDESDNVYVTGMDSNNSGGYDYATIKYNTSGIQQWISRYDGDFSDQPTCIQVDKTGNIYVTGISGPRSMNQSPYGFATVKYSNDGVQQWVASYGGSGSVGRNAPSALAVDTSGNVYVTGYHMENPHGFWYAPCYATVKYNKDGIQQWIVLYGSVNSDFSSVANDLAVDVAGNVYVTGSSDNGVGGSDYATIKYNIHGVLQWDIRYNDGAASGIEVDGTGNVYVTGQSGSDYTTIKYGSVNHAPMLNPIGNKTVTVGTMLTFTISATDQDGNPLQYSADNLPIGASLQSDNKFYWQPTVAQMGTYPNIHFQVSDGSLTTSENITIVVTNGCINQAPVLNPIGNKSVAVGDWLIFTISGTDQDGDSLQYSADNLPIGASLQSDNKFYWQPTVVQVGTYPNIHFQVSDGSLTASENITIVVTNGCFNHAPMLNPIGNKTVTVGTMLTFTISATDQDGDSLQYLADNLPIGASLQSDNKFRWQPTAGQVGTYTHVHFQVSDGNLTAPENITIVVTN